MRHRVFGRTLSRQANERKRLLRNLARDVILHGTVTTTLSKAKAVQPMVEKLVTHAKKGQGSNIRAIRKVISDRDVYAKLMTTANTALSDRSGGYTRMVKLGYRSGDATEMVRFGFVAVPAGTDGSEKAPAAKPAKAGAKARGTQSKAKAAEKKPARTRAKTAPKKRTRKTSV